jgi:hypothetical protein
MAEETDHMAMDLDIQEDLFSEICIPTHNKLQGKDSSLKIFSIFEVLQAYVRVKVSWFRANGVDKTNSDDREERNRASRGGEGEGEGGRKNTLELPRPYLELDHMLLYCLYDTKKVNDCRRCYCTNVAAKGCQLRNSRGCQF